MKIQQLESYVVQMEWRTFMHCGEGPRKVSWSLEMVTLQVQPKQNTLKANVVRCVYTVFPGL